MQVSVRDLQRRSPRDMPDSPTPRLDCDCLLGMVLHKPRSWLAAHDDELLTAPQLAAYEACTARRRTGLPVAYITGHKEFFGLDFAVTQDVLIPKPDTELLAEQAIAAISEYMRRGGVRGAGSIRIADVCTGSGCIVISVLSRFSTQCGIKAAASDISPAAIETAQQNARRLVPQHDIAFITGNLLDWNEPRQTFDIILSNPPYVPSHTARQLLADGRGEPLLALDGGTDGLTVIRKLIPQAAASLAGGGFFLIETGEYNSAETAALLSQAGFISVTTYTDLGGMPRVIRAQKP